MERASADRPPGDRADPVDSGPIDRQTRSASTEGNTQKPPRTNAGMDVKYELSDYLRVLKLASTPSWEEFSQVALIAGAGVFLVGLLGFIIFVIMTFVPGGV